MSKKCKWNIVIHMDFTLGNFASSTREYVLDGSCSNARVTPQSCWGTQKTLVVAEDWKLNWLPLLKDLGTKLTRNYYGYSRHKLKRKNWTQKQIKSKSFSRHERFENYYYAIVCLSFCSFFSFSFCARKNNFFLFSFCARKNNLFINRKKM